MFYDQANVREQVAELNRVCIEKRGRPAAENEVRSFIDHYLRRHIEDERAWMLQVAPAQVAWE